MHTKQVMAAELHGPEDLGSHVKKGSLVEIDGQRWRVKHHERKASGRFEIVFEETGGAQRTTRRDVLEKTTYTLVVEGEELRESKRVVACALCARMGGIRETFDPNARADLLAHMKNDHWLGSDRITEALAESCFYCCDTQLIPLDREGEDLLLALRPSASGSGVDLIDDLLDLKRRRRHLRRCLHHLREARALASSRPVADELDAIVDGLQNAADELGIDPESVETD